MGISRGTAVAHVEIVAEVALLIRRARHGEEGVLTELAVRSKAHWRYTRGQLEAWRADLTISADTIAYQIVRVAQLEDEISGFFVLLPGTSCWALEHLWVEPDAIGRGVGRALLVFASRLAANRGAVELSIDADPNAEAFYLACGAARVGVVPAPIEQDPLRRRPQLRLECARDRRGRAPQPPDASGRRMHRD